MADEHVYSIMLADADGNPLPLYYTKHTSIETNPDGTIKSVTLTIGDDEDIAQVGSVYVLVDTYPVHN